MITQQDNFDMIKIVDFGFSKILSIYERITEGKGTLNYAAPEIFMRNP